MVTSNILEKWHIISIKKKKVYFFLKKKIKTVNLEHFHLQGYQNLWQRNLIYQPFAIITFFVYEKKEYNIGNWSMIIKLDISILGGLITPYSKFQKKKKKSRKYFSTLSTYRKSQFFFFLIFLSILLKYKNYFLFMT